MTTGTSPLATELSPDATLDISIKQEKIDIRDLKRKSVRGGAMTLASQAVSTVVHLASTVILARMLTPADYGVIAMVTAITSFAGLFRELGLSSAAIQKKDLTTGQQTNLFWLNVAMGATLTTIVAACSPLVSWFYDKPELTIVTIALSFNFLIGSFGAQHGAMLVRNMQFGRKAVASITAGVLSLIVAVAFAYQGWSYWALVASSLTGSLISTTLLFLISPFWPGLPGRGRGIRQMVTFGAHVTAFDLVNYFHRNFDNILIGRFWGVESLGIYSRAYALLMMPVNAIRGPINSIAFPAMSKLLHDRDEYARFGRTTVYITAMVSMPIVSFLFFFSDVVINITLGQKWESVSPIFSMLAVASFIQPACGIRGIVLHSTGNGRRLFIWGIINGVCTTASFSVGVAWGPIGVATGYAITNYLILVPSLRYVFKGTSLTTVDFFTSIKEPAIFSMASGLSAFCLTSTLSFPNTIIRIGIALLTHVLIYGLLIASTGRGRQYIKNILALLFTKRYPFRKTKNA